MDVGDPILDPETLEAGILDGAAVSRLEATAMLGAHDQLRHPSPASAFASGDRCIALFLRLLVCGRRDLGGILVQDG